MPEISGSQLIKHIKHIDRTVQCIVVTSNYTVENAVKCMRNDGAYDFFKKPISPDPILRSVKDSLLLRKRILKIRNNERYSLMVLLG